MENRLLAYDPTIDLSSGSPADVNIITPLIDRMGEDPFDVDIPTFMQDSLIQQYPELAADDAGLLQDIFTSPFQMLLEPFKRQVEITRIGQSVNNADLMNDDEADALGANFFHDRDEGAYASGQVRLYFSAPTSSRVTTDKQLSSKYGRAYYPTGNSDITSSQMLFNRDGDQFFLDISVRAEEAGSEYNVEIGDINSIDDLDGVVRVANLSAFTAGEAREDNETYLGELSQALTERSLVTKRGALTRVSDLFGSSINAMQVVGAGEEGMNRDILEGTGEGFLHIVGDCSFFGMMVIVSAVTYKDNGNSGSETVQVGDTIRLERSYTDDPARNVYSAVITDFKVVDIDTADEKYVLFIDRTLEVAPGVTQGTGAKVAIFKSGYITISGTPGGISQNTTVPSNEIHLGGHTDVFIRPASDEPSEGVIPNLATDSPILSRRDISVTAGSNLVATAADLVSAGVEPEDTLVIESGNAAGSYRILNVGAPDSPAANRMRVDGLFEATESNLRARVVRGISIDLVEPKVPKLPFDTSSVSDLITTVGSKLFRLTTNNIQDYGAVAGDTIRILDGDNAGDYIIKSFDTVLGGKGPIVDVVAPATAANQRYEVFTVSDGLTFPLVRIKSLEVLDSSDQGTGITVPYGDAVDIRPTCAFEGAGDSVRVLDNELIIAPNSATLWAAIAESAIATPGTGKDARFSEEIEYADGTIRKGTSSAGGSPIDEFELNFPPFLWNGRNDSLIALTTREDPEFDIPTAGNHRTSDIAKAKIGDSLVILDGPNQGSYVIKDLRVLDMWAEDEVGHCEVALVQVDQELNTDSTGDFIDFIEEFGVGITSDQLATFIELAADNFYAAGGFFETVLIPKLLTTLNSQFTGTPFTDDDVRELVLDLGTTGYEVGSSATGTARALFLEPVSIELNFGTDPTFFRSINDPSLVYRLNPDLDPAQIFPESEEETEPTEWNRNLVLKESDLLHGYLSSGSSFAKRGIRSDDIIEYHPAINDLEARGDMLSSWMCVTTAGSNSVRLVLPRSRAVAAGGWSTLNAILPEPGHILFIDSGPDIGSYVITDVSDTNDLTSDPPSVIVQIDKSLTYSTNAFPVDTLLDFESKAAAVIVSSGNAATMNLDGFDLRLDRKVEEGAWSLLVSTVSFSGGNPWTAADVVTELNNDGTFSTYFVAVAVGDEVAIQTKLLTHREAVRVNAASSCLAILKFTSLQEDGGWLGAVAMAGTKKIYGDDLSNLSINGWVSVYAAYSDGIISAGEDESYLGTFQVLAQGVETTGARAGLEYAELDRSDNFAADAEVRWVGHAAPETTPTATTGGGKDLSSNYVRFRMYAEVPSSRDIIIPWDDGDNPIEDTSESQIEVAAAFISGDGYSHKMPYRVIRDHVLRISSTTMETQRYGALYYVDLPLIGLGVRSDFNINKLVGMEMFGDYRVDGYTLDVEKEIYTYSDEEQVSIILPRSVLPVGSTPDLDNELNLAGQNLQVNYDSATLVSNIQAFFDSPLDRVIVANVLVRHFLPSYVFLDVSYIGGDATSIVAEQIIAYVNNIDPDLNELVADDIVEIIRKRRATQVRLPINMIVLTHGTDRRIRGTQSEDVIGGTELPTFTGNFNQTYFIAGPDTSDDDPRPDGEQTYLTRL